MKYILCILPMIFFVSSCGKEVNTFGGSESDWGNSIIQTSDGGYVITGGTESNDGDFSGMNKGDSDIFVMKLSSQKNIQWTKTYGGSGTDIGNSVIQTRDGGFIITGYSTSNDGDFSGMNRGGRDIVVTKLSSNGEIQWNKTYGGSGGEGGNSIIQTSDGGYILTGETQSIDGDFSGRKTNWFDIFVMKLSPSGEINWKKTFRGSSGERGKSIIQSSDGGYTLTGSTGSNDGDFSGINESGTSIFVINLSIFGEIQWIKIFGGTGYDSGLSIDRTADGGYILTGETYSIDGDFNGLAKGGKDIFVLKISFSGDVQWIKILGGSGSDSGVSIRETTDGGYILTGYSTSNDGDFSGMKKGSEYIFVIKLSIYGDIQWNKTFGGGEDDRGKSIKQTSDGGYVLTGWTESKDGDFRGLNKGNGDIFIIRLDSYGK